MSDDPLREASDPTTSPGRLEHLFSGALRKRRLARDATPPEVIALLERLVSNPALPVSLVSRALRYPSLRVCATLAWRNPSVPLLLLQEPLPAYREAATALLREASDRTGHPALDPTQPVTLEALVEAWSQPGSPAHAADVQSLARHLASLFSLPWPS